MSLKNTNKTRILVRETCILLYVIHGPPVFSILVDGCLERQLPVRVGPHVPQQPEVRQRPLEQPGCKLGTEDVAGLPAKRRFWTGFSGRFSSCRG